MVDEQLFDNGQLAGGVIDIFYMFPNDFGRDDSFTNGITMYNHQARLVHND